MLPCLKGARFIAVLVQLRGNDLANIGFVIDDINYFFHDRVHEGIQCDFLDRLIAANRSFLVNGFRNTFGRLAS